MGWQMSACISWVLTVVIEKEASFEIETIDFWKGDNKTHYLTLQVSMNQLFATQ